MYWMLLPFRRYAQFSGRSRPKEYWLFVLFMMIAFFAAILVDSLFGLSGSGHYVERWPGGYSTAFVDRGGPLTLALCLGSFVPALAVAVRRLHDSDRTGWWLLISIVPMIGSLVLFVFMIWAGTRGSNRFGPDPLALPE